MDFLPGYDIEGEEVARGRSRSQKNCRDRHQEKQKVPIEMKNVTMGTLLYAIFELFEKVLSPWCGRSVRRWP